MDGHVRTDKPVVAAILVLYTALAVIAVPPQDYLRILLSVGVLMSLVAVVDRAWRADETPPITVLLVSFIAASVLVMAAFGAMGGENGPALPIGFAGAQVVTMWWVAMRWSVTHKQQRTPLRESFKVAIIAAVLLSIIASVGVVIAVAADRHHGVRLMLVYPAYFIGAALAAVVYWALQGTAHRPLGKYLIGALAGTCLYIAVGPVVIIMKQEPFVVAELLGLGAVCGFLVGPPVAFGLFSSSKLKPDPKIKRRRAIRRRK